MCRTCNPGTPSTLTRAGRRLKSNALLISGAWHCLQLDGLDSRDVPPRNPYAADIGAANVTTPAMHALALRAAKRSIVLLKNTVSKQGTHFGRQAGQLLPLSPTSLNGKIICAVGPNVNNTLNLLGNYVNKAHSNSMPTIASALQHVRVFFRSLCGARAKFLH